RESFLPHGFAEWAFLVQTHEQEAAEVAERAGQVDHQEFSPADAEAVNDLADAGSSWPRRARGRHAGGRPRRSGKGRRPGGLIMGVRGRHGMGLVHTFWR